MAQRRANNLPKGGRRDLTPHKFTPAARAAFLEALRNTGEIKAAAAVAGVSYSCIQYWRNKDESFEADYLKALGLLEDELMEQARKLALEGVEEPMFDKAGRQVGVKRRYSERVLLAWLKRRMDSWADRVRVEHDGRVEHEHKGSISVEQLTPDQRRLVRRLLAPQPQADRN